MKFYALTTYTLTSQSFRLDEGNSIRLLSDRSYDLAGSQITEQFEPLISAGVISIRPHPSNDSNIQYKSIGQYVYPAVTGTLSVAKDLNSTETVTINGVTILLSVLQSLVNSVTP